MMKYARTLCTLGMIITAAMTLISLSYTYDYWNPLTAYWVFALVREALDILQEVR